MNRYMYSVVKVTPRVGSGEFVNLAIIAGNDQLGDWAIRRVKTTRARRFCGIHVMTAASEFLDTIEERIDILSDRDQDDWLLDTAPADETPISEQFIDEWSTSRRGVVWLSSPMPVLAESSEEAIEMLSPDLFLGDSPREFERMTKKRLVSDMRSSYVAAGIDANKLRRSPQISVGKSRQFHLGADIAVVTDHAVQLCNAWSFQILKLEEVRRSVQAWGWNIRELQEHGGTLGAEHIKVPERVSLQVIVAPDPSDEGRRALDDARLVFDEVNAEVVSYADRQRAAEHASELAS